MPAGNFACREIAGGITALFLPFCARTKGDGCLASGKRELPIHRQTNFCASMRRNNIPHDNTRARAATAFWPKPQKAPKTLFNPRRLAGGAVTGGDVSRIAQNSRRKHKVLSSSRRSAFWPKPQKAPKTLFPIHPAALTNESPAPHRVRQAAPSALSCRPVHARSPALSGRLL